MPCAVRDPEKNDSAEKTGALLSYSSTLTRVQALKNITSNIAIGLFIQVTIERTKTTLTKVGAKKTPDE